MRLNIALSFSLYSISYDICFSSGAVLWGADTSDPIKQGDTVCWLLNPATSTVTVFLNASQISTRRMRVNTFTPACTIYGINPDQVTILAPSLTLGRVRHLLKQYGGTEEK